MLLIYDGDCGFCTTSARWIQRRLPQSIEVSPWQGLDLASFGLTEADVTTAAYWVDADGVNHRGHLAVGQSLIAAGSLWGISGRLIIHPPGAWLAKPVYGWVARNRYRLPGSTDACRLEP